ncbi:MAG: hypothetical protein O7A09_02245, partial [Proteobacteria bacterium]|nr:hypothetical protein [Pseudomonadota bacterium]
MRCPLLTLPLLCSLLAAAAPPASAVLIDSGDGTGNTSAPPDDPGWDHVGRTDTNLTAVYAGNGWVITAAHVGNRPVELLGIVYPWELT